MFSAYSWNPGPNITYKGLIKANITWQQRALRVRLITPSLKFKQTNLPHICIHIRLDARRKWNLWRRTSQVLHARYKIITTSTATATTVRHQWMGHVLTYGKRMFQRYAQPYFATFIDHTKAFNRGKNFLAGLMWPSNQGHRQCNRRYLLGKKGAWTLTTSESHKAEKTLIIAVVKASISGTDTLVLKLTRKDH